MYLDTHQRGNQRKKKKENKNEDTQCIGPSVVKKASRPLACRDETRRSGMTNRQLHHLRHAVAPVSFRLLVGGLGNPTVRHQLYTVVLGRANQIVVLALSNRQATFWQLDEHWETGACRASKVSKKRRQMSKNALMNDGASAMYCQSPDEHESNG